MAVPCASGEGKGAAGFSVPPAFLSPLGDTCVLLELETSESSEEERPWPAALLWQGGSEAAPLADSWVSSVTQQGLIFSARPWARPTLGSLLSAG